MRPQPIVTACLLAGMALLLYGFRVSVRPLTPEESAFNNRAQAVHVGATPLFFRTGAEAFLQPIPVYANAMVRAIGGDDVSGRIASAIAGAIDVALVFMIAHLITGRVLVGILAAGILMLTPAHWAIAQLGTDAIFPVPLVLIWFWSLLRFCKWDAPGALALAAVMLGLTAYSHPAGPLTAVFLWILTLVVARRRNRARLLVATLIFGAMGLPAAAWFYVHPETYADTFGRWFVFAAHLRNPIDGLRAFMNPNTLGNRASLYWGLWDPSWLFFKTRDAGAPLPILAAPFILLGVYRCARQWSRPSAQLVIGALLIAPLTGASFGVPHYLADAATVLPLLALLAGLGVDMIVDLVAPRRGSLEDDEAAGPIDTWDGHDISPRS
jgi:hypothetical protein